MNIKQDAYKLVGVPSWIAINSDIIQGQCKCDKAEEDIKQNTKTFVMNHAEGYWLHTWATITYRTSIPTDRVKHTTGNGSGEGENVKSSTDTVYFLHVGCNLYNLIYLAEVRIKGNNATSKRQTFLLFSRKKKQTLSSL